MFKVSEVIIEKFFISFKDLIFPLTIAYITARLTLKDYKDKSVFDKQISVYLKFLNILFLFQKEPYQQFSRKYLSTLENMQSEFNIFASKKCRKDFSTILDKIQKLYIDYQQNRDPNEDEIIVENLSSAILLQESYDRYKNENQIEVAELNKLIQISIKHIQKSLRI